MFTQVTVVTTSLPVFVPFLGDNNTADWCGCVWTFMCVCVWMLASVCWLICVEPQEVQKTHADADAKNKAVAVDVARTLKSESSGFKGQLNNSQTGKTDILQHPSVS